MKPIQYQPTEEELLQKQIELEEIATKNCLIRVVAGSHAYGTNLPTSDWDERGIFVDDMKRTLLPFEKIEQVQYRQDDIVLFELSKYMPLLLAQNPNVIELLWTDPSDILFISDAGKLLLENRHNFLSKKVKDSYVGYAEGQLKRIKGHNKWLNNPQPEKEPELKDFTSVIWNYTKQQQFNKVVPTDGYIAVSMSDNNYCLWEAQKLGLPKYKNWIDQRGNPIVMEKGELDKININHFSPDLIVKVNMKAFQDNHTNWKSYWTWKENRNEKRGELEALYGYDTKHAMHLIRLLRSGIDILETGIVPVRRNDAEYLLDIRNGKFTYEEIVHESERLSAKVAEISKKTALPEDTNYELAKEIMIEIYKKQWGLSLNVNENRKLKM